ATAAHSAARAAAWTQIQSDTAKLETSANPEQSALWPDAPEALQRAWDKARDWLAAHPGHDFWIRWYEAALEGRPLTGDWESHDRLLTDIALIPEEDWQQGAEHVAGLIAEIEKRYPSDPKVSALRRGRNEVANAIARAAEARAADLEILSDIQKQTIEKLTRELERSTTRIAELTDALQIKLNGETDSTAQSLANFRAELENLLETHKEKMDAVVLAFRQDQALKAPVAMWDEKHTHHRAAAWWSLFWFILSLGMIGVGAGGLIYAIVHWPDSMTTLLTPPWCNPATGQGCSSFSLRGLLVSGAALTALTVLLWFARLRMKIYLSERHLAEDARERKAFVEAYLGLLENGDTSQEAQQERSIIYSALFRPSSDGMVKDEGGIDPSITAALSKLLSR
ncbi:DUF6161 domain-containing protein, partial [Sinirhodobacter huangdaonensis]